MVMYTRKQPRLNDGYHERRQTHPQQSVNKYPAKTEGDADSRNDKMRDSRDASPASKIPRKSSSPDVREQKTNSLQSKPRDKCRVSGDAVDGSSQNNSARPISNSHSSEQHKNPATQPHDLADDWSEHISSSGKKYYYNCRTEVSQWEKPKEWVEREQRQKEAANRIVANSFPKDRDYRREAMQTAVQSNSSNRFTEDKHSSEVGSVLAQTVLSQTSKHNDRDYRLPRTEAPGSGTSSSTPLQQQASLGVKPGSSLPNCTPSPVPSSPFNLPEQQQQQHQQHHKKQNDSNGANTLTKPHPAGSSTGQRPEKKGADAPTDRASTASATPSPSPSSTSRLTPVTPTSATMPSLPSQDPAVLRQILHTSPQINPSLERLQEAFTQTLSKILLAAAPTLLPQAVQAAHQAHQQSQSPASQTSDVSSPRSHISPRVATPQTSGSQTRAHATTPHSHNSAQSKASAMSVKCGVHQSQGSQQAGGTERHTYTSPGSPATSGGHRHHPSGGHPSPARTMSGSHAGSAQPSVSSLSNACQALSGLSSLSPGLSSHYCENLTKHVQGWPAEHLEKQAARLREESYSLGCLQMSEICTELKNARSLVRVSEIQATLREQRILFLRQQNKELEKLKNQNSFMM
uniref:WW domain-containing adapter protein with coiled-coil isoform X3 n=1 Tax=Petromyzon marinus TaxID=7757 RepID=A0AAJ7WYE1_PETMA|nr:WW domain-containing adapter protein with coiled-coil isoform X3 [Petromyzon marinus]